MTAAASFRHVLTLAFALFAMLLAPKAALAQAAPEVSSRLSPSVVEVGDFFEVELTAMVDSGQPVPSSPALTTPPEVSAAGPSVATRSFSKFGTGMSPVSKVGISARWRLTAMSPGTYLIPAPSVLIGTQRHQGQAMQVEVVPVGQGPPGAGGPPSSPFLPLPASPGGSGWPFGFLDDSIEPDDDFDTAEGLRMDEALDDQIFLRAVVDQEDVVIGEQITASFYLYFKVEFEPNETRDAPMSDFVRVPLLTDPGATVQEITRVGGERWGVRLLERVAIFPVRTGVLSLGKMTGRFTGRRIGSRVERESNEVFIKVIEPPENGRPPGYQLGDVGKFNLSADVAPRAIEQGGSVGVTLSVSGSGNLPAKLQIPGRTGLEWSDPEKRDDIKPVSGIVGGTRTFRYIVRIKDSGKVELGTVELPFFDPDTERYEIAKVDLGAVDVEAVAPTDDAVASEPSVDPFERLESPRPALASFNPAPQMLTPGWTLWAAIGGPPMGVALLLLLARGVGAAKNRRRSAKESLDKVTATALKEARKAEKESDLDGLCAALERALHSAIEDATGLKSRGLLRDDLRRELTDRGIRDETVDRALSAFERIEEVRFAPSSDERALGELRKEAKDAATEILAQK